MEETNSQPVVTKKKYKFVAISEKTHAAMDHYRKTLGSKRAERTFDVAIQNLLSRSAILDQEMG